MKTKYKFFTTILGLVFLSTTLVLPQVEATSSPWYVGARTNINSNASELSGFVGVPPLPSSGALSYNTLLFIGGWSQSSSFLNQPEIRAYSSTTWVGYLEVWSAATGQDAETPYITNVNLSPGDTARFDVYMSSGSSCQTIKDGTTGATASKCFSANNYGNTFTTNWTHLESVDTTSSDFHSMDGTTTFTSVQYYVNGIGTSISMTGATYGSPSCMSSSGGTGSLSITLTNC